MATKKKALQAAAGAAGGAGEATYVDDVFSTYLYEGNGSSQTISNGIALADGIGGGTSTEFDGTSDYLIRSSDLTGNIDSKTFTFSCWFYFNPSSSSTYIYTNDNGNIQIKHLNTEKIQIVARNSSGTLILNWGNNASTVTFPKNIWANLLVSIDMDDQNNCAVYLNDVQVSMGSFDTFTTGETIDFTKTSHSVGAYVVGSGPIDGRLAHVYLDYTYRDLSVEANRRYFIDADGGSTSVSTLSALSPILYLPMTDGYSVGENLGTGGDFTANGSPTIVDGGTEYLSDYGQGGMVWFKTRSNTYDNEVVDTERGAGYVLSTNQTYASTTQDVDHVTSFNSNGFTIGGDNGCNYSGRTFASWTFRKAPGFFDVVTYTGNNTANRQIAHNLGVTPGMIIIKDLTTANTNWVVYHKSVGNTGALKLNLTNSTDTHADYFNNTSPTDTHFTVDTILDVNNDGDEFVAYLFADGDDADAQIFGTDGDQAVVKCGSYTGNGSTTGPEIDCGFEPQWVLIKGATSGAAQNWGLFDTMRGLPTGSNPAVLHPNKSDAESSPVDYLEVNATGFQPKSGNGVVNASGETYIYIAIRRPHKPAESGSEVFAVDTADSTVEPYFVSNFTVDAVISRDNKNTATNNRMTSRLTQARTMYTDVTNAESSNTNSMFDYMNGYRSGTGTDANDIAWMFKRSPGFFDVVCYTGNGSAGRIVNHNLGVAPEMIWTKTRTNTRDWYCHHTFGDTTYGNIKLSQNASGNTFNYTDNYYMGAKPTETDITISGEPNYSSENYIAYLFASQDGISKVGSYTGNGTSQTIDCGFSAGARFVLIKGDFTNDWHIWDTERGIVAGNDPSLALNNANAQNSSYDTIDPDSSGFIVNQTSHNKNYSGNTYIYLAIA